MATKRAAKKRPKKNRRAAKKRPVSAPSPPTVPKASIFHNPGHPLSPRFVGAIEELEQSLGMPVWLLVQDGDGQADSIDVPIASAFYAHRESSLKRGEKVALLVDSYGGQARSAFEIASLLKRYCGGFTAIVPRHAKSAGTLLVLGSERLIMAEFSELGPLDMQMDVADREERLSVLDEAQALERLNAFAMSIMDETMFLLLKRTGMKVGTLLPHVRELATGMMRPLFESVDVVRFTQMSRLMKVAEEYARRLLVPQYHPEQADTIARKLAENYPEHGFIIYRDEAEQIGLKPEHPTAEMEQILSKIIEELPGMTVIGRIQQVSP